MSRATNKKMSAGDGRISRKMKTGRRKVHGLSRAVMSIYSPKVGNNTLPVPVNGHCPQSPCGAHWWLLEPTRGATSQGRCHYCKTRRAFLNWVEISYIERSDDYVIAGMEIR